jgi:hypothetical protein
MKITRSPRLDRGRADAGTLGGIFFRFVGI